MSDWSDDRLDHLDRRVDEGFERMDQQFEKVDKQFERVETRCGRIEERLAETPTRKEMNDGFAEIRGAVLGLHRTFIASAIAIVVALIGVVGALLVS